MNVSRHQAIPRAPHRRQPVPFFDTTLSTGDKDGLHLSSHQVRSSVATNEEQKSLATALRSCKSQERCVTFGNQIPRSLDNCDIVAAFGTSRATSTAWRHKNEKNHLRNFWTAERVELQVESLTTLAAQATLILWYTVVLSAFVVQLIPHAQWHLSNICGSAYVTNMRHADAWHSPCVKIKPSAGSSDVYDVEWRGTDITATTGTLKRFQRITFSLPPPTQQVVRRQSYALLFELTLRLRGGRSVNITVPATVECTLGQSRCKLFRVPLDVGPSVAVDLNVTLKNVEAAWANIIAGQGAAVGIAFQRQSYTLGVAIWRYMALFASLLHTMRFTARCKYTSSIYEQRWIFVLQLALIWYLDPLYVVALTVDSMPGVLAFIEYRVPTLFMSVMIGAMFSLIVASVAWPTQPAPRNKLQRIVCYRWRPCDPPVWARLISVAYVSALCLLSVVDAVTSDHTWMSSSNDGTFTTIYWIVHALLLAGAVVCLSLLLYLRNNLGRRPHLSRRPQQLACRMFLLVFTMFVLYSLVHSIVFFVYYNRQRPAISSLQPYAQLTMLMVCTFQANILTLIYTNRSRYGGVPVDARDTRWKRMVWPDAWYSWLARHGGSQYIFTTEAEEMSFYDIQYRFRRRQHATRFMRSRYSRITSALPVTLVGDKHSCLSYDQVTYESYVGSKSFSRSQLKTHGSPCPPSRPSTRAVVFSSALPRCEAANSVTDRNVQGVFAFNSVGRLHVPINGCGGDMVGGVRDNLKCQMICSSAEGVRGGVCSEGRPQLSRSRRLCALQAQTACRSERLPIERSFRGAAEPLPDRCVATLPSLSASHALNVCPSRLRLPHVTSSTDRPDAIEVQTSQSPVYYGSADYHSDTAVQRCVDPATHTVGNTNGSVNVKFFSRCDLSHDLGQPGLHDVSQRLQDATVNGISSHLLPFNTTPHETTLLSSHRGSFVATGVAGTELNARTAPTQQSMPSHARNHDDSDVLQELERVPPAVLQGANNSFVAGDAVELPRQPSVTRVFLRASRKLGVLMEVAERNLIERPAHTLDRWETHLFEALYRPFQSIPYLPFFNLETAIDCLNMSNEAYFLAAPTAEEHETRDANPHETVVADVSGYADATAGYHRSCTYGQISEGAHESCLPLPAVADKRADAEKVAATSTGLRTRKSETSPALVLATDVTGIEALHLSPSTPKLRGGGVNVNRYVHTCHASQEVVLTACEEVAPQPRLKPNHVGKTGGRADDAGATHESNVPWSNTTGPGGETYMNVNQYGYNTLFTTTIKNVQAIIVKLDTTAAQHKDKAARLIVAFRGTVNLSNMRHNLDVRRVIWDEMQQAAEEDAEVQRQRSQVGGLHDKPLVHLSKCDRYCGCVKRLRRPPTVHSGYLGLWKALRDGVLDKVESVLRSDSDHIYRVFVTGHSMGGALSCLCAYSLTRRLRFMDYPIPDVTVYTFGQPCFSNRTFRRLYDKTVPRTFRVMNEDDMVVTVGSVSAACHVGVQVDIDSHGNYIVKPTVMERLFRPTTGRGLTVLNHLLVSYGYSLNMIASMTNCNARAFQPYLVEAPREPDEIQHLPPSTPPPLSPAHSHTGPPLGQAA